MSNSHTEGPILVLGAGINGAAIARELALAGRSVTVVDTADIASGTTAYSSRLIHGGLRYLEHRELDLVRESLAERTRLLGLAPDFVRPIELFIPVGNRFGGIRPTLARFLLHREPSRGASRGLWLVRAGLWFYDRYARDKTLPHHAVHRAHAADVPRVASDRYRWLCSYWDAQIPFPERFTVALLKDAEQVAAEIGREFRVFTYHEATLDGREVTVRPAAGRNGESVCRFEPAAIINATGAWVDATLAKLHVPERRLIAGTKGTHLFTWNTSLCNRLGDRGIYFEAADGRPIFVIGLLGGTLIGTTDLPFEGDPATARAEPREVEYLLDSVHDVFPDANITPVDVAWHCCGVRPLPYVDAASPAAITRRHWLHDHAGTPVPLYSVIGGKLTTCRSLAEETVQTVLGKWESTSRERPILEPAGADFGPHISDVLRDEAAVRRVIDSEWVTTLGDLVERRLMLLYHQSLSRADLQFLADVLADAGKIAAGQKDAEIERCERRLREHFGLRLERS